MSSLSTIRRAKVVAGFCLSLFAVALVLASPQHHPRLHGIDRNLLRGAWTSGGPSFDMLIQDSTILFEFDMKEHPYQLADSLLIIDFEDPTLGIQTKRILRLTRDELVFRDLQSETVGAYHRMRN